MAPAARRVTVHLKAGAVAEAVIEERHAQRRHVGAIPLAVEVAVPICPTCMDECTFRCKIRSQECQHGTAIYSKMFENGVCSCIQGVKRVATAVEGGVSQGSRATSERCVPVRLWEQLGIVVAKPQLVRVWPHMPSLMTAVAWGHGGASEIGHGGDGAWP